ncbi:serine/threonine protein kinase [Phytophthora cinnamomi]|uniref:serine/threonine protein kinase n=1 Tax=Phytophthora cinnamomi TaxID=4785 RepID=UPI00355987F7|nr:serine/threonine protein kinase [Phytophthora cinnamomi]
MAAVDTTEPGLLSAALAAAASRCQQMREHGPMCARVCGRLQQLRAAAATSSNPAAERRLGDVAASFASFLRKRRERSFARRLASSRKVEEALRGFHADADALQQQLQPQQAEAEADDAASNWRRQWTRDRRAALRELAQLAASAQVLEAERADAGFEEALCLLQFELQHRRAQYAADETAAALWQLMQRTLRRLCAAATTTTTTGAAAAGTAATGTGAAAGTAAAAAAAAAVQLPAVPDWFIPRDDVDFDADACFACGSYGSVHRGTWTKGATGGSGAKVVLKCLLVDDVEARRSFYQEVGVWRRLDHPHVLKLYGACHVSSPAFFVCDDATHGSFSDFLEQQTQTQTQRWRLFYEAALGLGYLHAEKVVHGDLKCTNLLVGSDLKAKLCDFGFSYVRSQSAGLSAKSQTEAIRWKAPECLAPPHEQASAQFNPRFASDVYSLGMCVVEAFLGEAPYGLMDDDEIMTRLFEHEPCPRPPGMRDDEWALVERMVQPDWTRRISLQDAIDGLKAFADREHEERQQQQEGVGDEEEDEEATAAAAASTRECGHCEASMPVEFAFCGDCGTSMTTRTEQAPSVAAAAAQQKNACPCCEESVDSTDHFCRHCGYHLDADPAFANKFGGRPIFGHFNSGQ